MYGSERIMYMSVCRWYYSLFGIQIHTVKTNLDKTFSRVFQL